MKQRHQKKSTILKSIASERIIELFKQADLRFDEDHALSDRYVELARKIAMRYKVKIPKELKRRFCKSCHSFLVHGKNCRVRLNSGKVVYFCMICKNFMRFGLN
jgi:ribonuclease P protein subunit RPR2